MILDFLKNRDKFRSGGKTTSVNWFNIAGIVVGAAVANTLHWGIAALNAMIVRRCASSWASCCARTGNQILLREDGRTMLLKELHLGNAQDTVDIRITDGKFEAIAPHLAPLPGRRR